MRLSRPAVLAAGLLAAGLFSTSLPATAAPTEPPTSPTPAPGEKTGEKTVTKVPANLTPAEPDEPHGPIPGDLPGADGNMKAGSSSIALAPQREVAGESAPVYNRQWPAGTVVDENNIAQVPFWAKTTVKGQTCVLDASLYVKADVDSNHPVPALIGGHGFNGSKANDRALKLDYARKGYAVITVSQLGYGQSTCRVGMNNPTIDGESLKSLVDILGGKQGVAFADKELTLPLPPVDFVKKDDTDLDGKHEDYDPRVGAFGFSNGGGMTYAVAAVDHRVDAIVPGLTFADMRGTFYPNTVTKAGWGLNLLIATQINWIGHNATNPFAGITCGSWSPAVCTGILGGLVQGHENKAMAAMMDEASPIEYAAKLKAPTLMVTGQWDSLFTYGDSVRMYDKLRAQGTPAQLIYTFYGHNKQDYREIDVNAPKPDTYVFQRMDAFFRQYLGDGTPQDPATFGKPYSYFRPWGGDGSIASYYSYADSPSVGTEKKYYLNTGARITSEKATTSETHGMAAGLLNAPTSLRKFDAPNLFVPVQPPVVDTPGTFLRYTSDALTSPLRVSGSPKIDMKFDTSAAQQKRAKDCISCRTVLYFKMYDVAPDGSRQLIHELAMPYRITDTAQRVRTELSGMSYEFAAGHRFALDIAGGDLSFTGEMVASHVQVDTGKEQSLMLPVVD